MLYSVACHKTRRDRFCDSLSIRLRKVMIPTSRFAINKVIVVICDTQDWRTFIVILKRAARVSRRKILFT